MVRSEVNPIVPLLAFVYIWGSSKYCGVSI